MYLTIISSLFFRWNSSPLNLQYCLQARNNDISLTVDETIENDKIKSITYKKEHTQTIRLIKNLLAAKCSTDEQSS